MNTSYKFTLRFLVMMLFIQACATTKLKVHPNNNSEVMGVNGIENDPNNRKGIVHLVTGDNKVVDALKEVTQDSVFFSKKDKIVGFDINEVKYYQIAKINRPTRNGIIGLLASIGGAVLVVHQIENTNYNEKLVAFSFFTIMGTVAYSVIAIPYGIIKSKSYLIYFEPNKATLKELDDSELTLEAKTYLP